MEKGPLSVMMNADTLQFYKEGIWDPLFCDSTSLDHGKFLFFNYVIFCKFGVILNREG